MHIERFRIGWLCAASLLLVATADAGTTAEVQQRITDAYKDPDVREVTIPAGEYIGGSITLKGLNSRTADNPLTVKCHRVHIKFDKTTDWKGGIILESSNDITFREFIVEGLQGDASSACGRVEEIDYSNNRLKLRLLRP